MAEGQRTMDKQYYYKLMASYLSKRNCDESLMRYLFGKNALKKTPEELERADERKRRLQRERSRRYRALKNARRHHEGGRTNSSDGDLSRAKIRSFPDTEGVQCEDDDPSDFDEPPTLCDLNSDCASDDNCAPIADRPSLREGALSVTLREFLTSPNAELDYPTVHSLMFHWLQT